MVCDPIGGPRSFEDARQPLVETFETRGVALAYEVRGSGPGLVIPMLNFPWLALTYVDEFAKHFTVVVASPRGYGESTRLPAGAHVVSDLRGDLIAVCDHIGLDRFAMFGYSFSAAVSAWLAVGTERAAAVAAGGFPLLGDYRRAKAFIDERLARVLAYPEGMSKRMFGRRVTPVPPREMLQRPSLP